jgi:hypothetical protein
MAAVVAVMIEIVEGRGVGAGKSFYVCGRIIDHLAVGGSVCASDTFGLKWDACVKLVAKRFGVMLEADQYRTFSEDDVPRLHEVTPQGTPECPVLVVVDECHTKLNARDWADKSKREFFNWLTQSRHDDNDCMFISQAAANIDKQIARLVTYIQRARNMTTWKIPGLGKWPLKQFVISTYDSDGRTCLEKKWVWHDKEIFACYESKVMKGRHKRSGEVIAKRKLQKANAEKTSPMFKILLVVIPLLLVASVWKGCSLYNEKVRPKKPVAAAAVPVGVDSARANASEPVIVREAWRSCSGGQVVTTLVGGVRKRAIVPFCLVTASAVYMQGEMSAFGMVEEVRWPDHGKSYAIARCKRGTALTFVVAEHREEAILQASAPVPVTR